MVPLLRGSRTRRLCDCRNLYGRMYSTMYGRTYGRPRSWTSTYLLVAAESIPLGDQDILYFNGLSAATGSGKPPQRETSSRTTPPLLWMLLTAFIISWKCRKWRIMKEREVERAGKGEREEEKGRVETEGGNGDRDNQRDSRMRWAKFLLNGRNTDTNSK